MQALRGSPLPFGSYYVSEGRTTIKTYSLKSTSPLPFGSYYVSEGRMSWRHGPSTMRLHCLSAVTTFLREGKNRASPSRNQGVSIAFRQLLRF